MRMRLRRCWQTMIRGMRRDCIRVAWGVPHERIIFVQDCQSYVLLQAEDMGVGYLRLSRQRQTGLSGATA